MNGPRLGRLTVGVMGSSRDEHAALAEPLGALLARLGVNLLTGAGRGVMTAVSRSFVSSSRQRGLSIGIVPCESLEERHLPRAGSPNSWVELPIFTHLPVSGIDGTDDLSRNHINVLSSDAIVALPGSEGTISEVELAIRYGRPIVAFAESSAQVERFDASVLRLFDIADVDRFLTSLIVGKK